MTRRRQFLTLAVAVTIAASLAPGLPASAAEPYAYPVRPGDAAWAVLATHKDMERVTQLPEKLLNEVSTSQLATIVLDYPLLMDALAFNSVQEGFDTVASRFNGLQELLRRPDSGEALLALYRKHDPNASDTGKAAWRSWGFEILLAQPEVLKTFSKAGLDKLLQSSRAHYSAKLAAPDVHGQASLEHTAVLLGRALAIREGWDYRQSSLLRNAFAPMANPASAAMAVDRHFAEPQTIHAIADETSIQDTVFTPNGTAVTVIGGIAEFTPAQISSMNAHYASIYPQATQIGNSSKRYNCHSYAWHWASTSNGYWMNDPGDNKYWEDNSYRPWHPPLIVFPNMKWSWASGDHSGVENGTSLYIRSKWGQAPLMYHWWAYSPYNASIINYYYR